MGVLPGLSPDSGLVTSKLSRNRSFRLLWAGQFLALTAWQTCIIAFTLVVLSTTGSPAMAGLLGGLSYLTFLVYLPIGVLSDRFDRRKIMAVSLSIEACVIGLVALFVHLGRPGFLLLCVAVVLQGLCTEAYSVAEGSALPQIVGDDQVAEAVAKNVARSSLAVLVGPTLGGVLFGFSAVLPFLVSALALVASMVCVLLMRGRFREARQDGDGSERRDVLLGLRLLWQMPVVRYATLLTAASEVTWGAVDLVLVVRAREGGGSSLAIGLMIACMGAGGVVGSVFSSRLQAAASLRQILVGVVLVETLCLVTLLLTRNALVMGVLVFMGSLGFPSWNGLLGALVTTSAPDEVRGRVTAANRMICALALPFGVMAVGQFMGRGRSTLGVLVLLAWHTGILVSALLVRAFREEQVTAGEGMSERGD
jgi:predicted MFS family arabinose efflux permease